MIRTADTVLLPNEGTYCTSSYLKLPEAAAEAGGRSRGSEQKQSRAEQVHTSNSTRTCCCTRTKYTLTPSCLCLFPTSPWCGATTHQSRRSSLVTRHPSTVTRHSSIFPNQIKPIQHHHHARFDSSSSLNPPPPVAAVVSSQSVILSYHTNTHTHTHIHKHTPIREARRTEV